MILFEEFPKFFSGSVEELAEKILKEADKPHKNRYVVPTNLDVLRIFYTEKEAQDAIKNGWIYTADGFPLVKFSRLFFGYRIYKKISGVELTYKIIELLQKRKKKLKVYFFGGSGDTRQKIIKNLKEKYKNLNWLVAGFSSAYFDNKDRKIVKEEVEKINRVDPDILFIGLGSPKQEIFLYRNRKVLRYGIAICVGRTINILAGDEKQEPPLIENLGLTFIYRSFKKGGGRILRRVLQDITFLITYTLKKFFKLKRV